MIMEVKTHSPLLQAEESAEKQGSQRWNSHQRPKRGQRTWSSDIQGQEKIDGPAKNERLLTDLQIEL